MSTLPFSPLLLCLPLAIGCGGSGDTTNTPDAPTAPAPTGTAPGDKKPGPPDKPGAPTTPNEAGKLDTTFGVNGRLALDQVPTALVADRTSGFATCRDLLVRRVTEAGAVDVTFGTDTSTHVTHTIANCSTIAPLSGGGYSVVLGVNFRMTRLLANGAIDSSFGTDGSTLLSTAFSFPRGDAAFAPDGTVVTAGSQIVNGVDLAIERFSATGTQMGARIRDPLPGQSLEPLVVVPLKGGQTLIAGTRGPAAGTPDFYELDAAGTLTAQGSAAVEKFGFISLSSGFATPDGGAVLAGEIEPVAGDRDLGILRVAMGTGGATITSSFKAGRKDVAYVHAVVVLPDGRVLAAADTRSSHVLVARFTADGKLDPTFGVGGIAEPFEATEKTSPRHLVVSATGAVVLSAEVGDHAAVVRLKM